ncbi:MAG: hypothetical protein K8W52_10505, partial [Deltaproteobacteria bacterium]|nr:hypothetical protein [Deltaproteobacteria bacterium]
APAPAPAHPATAHRRWPIIAAALAAAAATAVIVVIAMRPAPIAPPPPPPMPIDRGPLPPPPPDPDPSWRAAFDAGRPRDAREQLAAAIVRNPDNNDLAARALLLDLIISRADALDRAARLNGRTEPPLLADALAAAAAVRRDDPEAAAEALAGAVRAATPGSLDERLLRLTRASLYRAANRVELARTEYAAILDRNPAFAPALDPMLAFLYRADDATSLTAASALVQGYATAAPSAPDLPLRRARLAIARRAYGDALAIYDRYVNDHPGDVTIAAQRGDLLVLTGNPGAAVAAYAAIPEPSERAVAIAGALAHANYDTACSLTVAIDAYPPHGARAGLGSLVVDAALLARMTDDKVLAKKALAALATSTDPATDGAREFAAAVARALGLPAPPPGELDKRAFLIADAFGTIEVGLLPELVGDTAPAALDAPGVSPHLAPVLLFMRAQNEAGTGDVQGALATLSRVLEPATYQPTRGLVYGPAMQLRASLLDRAGRKDEARAVRQALKAMSAIEMTVADDCSK